MRAALALAAATLCLAASSPAHACGEWSMTDTEKHFEIRWLINAGSISREDAKGKHRIAALYLDLDNPRGLRVASGKRVVFDLVGGKVLRYGTAIGKVTDDGQTVTFGAHVYTVELDAAPPQHEMPTYQLTVKRGDTVIISTAEASSLCAGLHRDPPMSDAESRDEVRRRAIFYLAWRERGM